MGILIISPSSSFFWSQKKAEYLGFMKVPCHHLGTRSYFFRTS